VWEKFLIVLKYTHPCQRFYKRSDFPSPIIFGGLPDVMGRNFAKLCSLKKGSALKTMDGATGSCLSINFNILRLVKV